MATAFVMMALRTTTAQKKHRSSQHYYAVSYWGIARRLWNTQHYSTQVSMQETSGRRKVNREALW